MSWRPIIDSILVRSPAKAMSSSCVSERLLVLAYHGIEDRECFRKQVEYMSTELQPVGIGDVLEALEGRELPRKATLLTFDDADCSIKEKALPILQEYSIPAVAFVVAGHLDTDRPYWWQEVDELMTRGARIPTIGGSVAQAIRTLKGMQNRDRLECIRKLQDSLPHTRIKARNLKRSDLSFLQQGGIAVGNHSMTHPILDRCSDGEVRDEVTLSHDILEEALAEAPKAFAYPNGNYDPRVASLLRNLGYEAGFMFDHRVGRLSADKRFRISRVRVSSTTRLERFRLIASGLHPMLHHALGRP